MPAASDPAEFLATEFPQTNCTVEAVGGNTATVRREIGANKVRPGAMASGPVLTTVANVALCVAIRGEIGIVPVAVTTSLSIDFMRKPAPDRAIVRVRKLMKLGKSLAFGQVSLCSEGLEESVAHALGTYSIPR